MIDDLIDIIANRLDNINNITFIRGRRFITIDGGIYADIIFHNDKIKSFIGDCIPIVTNYDEFVDTDVFVGNIICRILYSGSKI